MSGVLHTPGSLTGVAQDLAKHKLDFVGVPEVRWDKCGTVPANNCTLLYGKQN